MAVTTSDLPDSLSGEVYIAVTIAGRPCHCLLDTGSEVTLIPSLLAKGVRIEPTSQRLIAANGTTIPVTGSATITVSAGKQRLRITGFVSDHIVELMVGVDWLKTHNAVWNFRTSEVELDGDVYRLLSKESTGWCRRVVVQESTIIPAMSETFVPTKVLLNSPTSPDDEQFQCWMTEPGEPKPGLYIARMLVPDRCHDVPVRVMNVMSRPMELKSGTVMSDLQAVKAMSADPAVAESREANKMELLRGIVDRSHESLSPTHRQRLLELLVEYSDTFSADEHDLGWTDIVHHSIDTADAKPVRQPLRRHPPAHLDAIQNHISDMLKQNIIEPARSPWASNIVLAKKKDGTLRCCIDYRQLNNVTRKDAYPLPRTDVCLDAMSGARWFTTFDLRSGYHQVCLDPADSDKTAFICREGMFRFRTMPFGLCNAGATFQRLMDTVMSGLAFDVCLVYLDDIIVFSIDEEQHFERLRMVFDRLRAAGLKLKPSKCSVFQESVEFLGHLVSQNGISAHPDKTAAVIDWPTPCTVKEVRAFVGFCSYYRRFVLGFASIAAPLHALTGKDRTTFSWSPDCTNAFESLKHALTSPPILAMPSDSGDFYLDTDASDIALGGVLSQVQNGTERVIAYASRKLNRQELNYCTTRKELLAVVHFLKYFRHYLLGRHFVVRTDHAALQWLRKTPEPIGQQARWLELLEEFDFEVVHRPGFRHANADGLSRKPCRGKGCCEKAPTELTSRLVTTVLPSTSTSTSMNDSATTADPIAQTLNVAAPVSTPTDRDLIWSYQEIALEQQRDTDIAPVYTAIASGSERPSSNEISPAGECSKALWHQWQRLSVREGVLCRKFESADGLSINWQIVLPHAYRDEFVRLAHSGITGGHLGRKRTQEQVQRRAYWPGWSEDVCTILRRCEPCARYHRGLPPKQVALQPFSAGMPWELVSIDITGPHPRSTKGYVYILTVMDHFTKWAEAIPLVNHTAPTVARALALTVFARFGFPVRLLSDRGPEFEGELFQEFCRWMGIDKLRTTPYKPSTNGMLERFHRTLNAMLAKAIRGDQRDWCELVPMVAAAYRSSIHETTCFTPNFLFLGRENRAPLDIAVGYPELTHDQPSSHNAYVAEYQEKMRRAYEIVRDHLAQAAQTRKDRYDLRVKPMTFSTGQWVWYYYPRRYVGKSPKWQMWYTGPYLIVRTIPPSNAVLQKSKRGKPFVVHCDKLKHVHLPPWHRGSRSRLAQQKQPRFLLRRNLSCRTRRG